MIARKLYYSLSPNMRRVARRCVYFPVDVWQSITGKRNSLVPPKGMIFTGSGDFVKSGQDLVNLCIQHAQLKPNHQVLDVGCGIGRLAVALSPYLNSHGAYYGFDVVQDGINWCTKNISPKHPNFHFKFTPLRNDLYNLSTEERAENFTFPYPNNQFDLVVLTSVFTHMQPPEVQHYLKEIKRVLKPGGKCLATFFVIDEQTHQTIKTRTDVMQFNYEYEEYFLHDNKVKDANIAFKQQALQNMAQQAQLNITTSNPGWWRGTPKTNSSNYQDVIIFTA
jgi:ubiquinone/menaquinone biosynthesis C-methylase UbiE